MDMSGKSTISEMVSKQLNLKLRRNYLMGENEFFQIGKKEFKSKDLDVEELADSLAMGARIDINDYSNGGINPYALVEDDYCEQSIQGQGVLQESMHAIRGFALAQALCPFSKFREEIGDILSSQNVKEFINPEVTVFLEVSHATRLARLVDRLEKSPKSVTPADMLLVCEPAVAARYEQLLREIVTTHFNARVLRNESKPAMEIADVIANMAR